MSDEMSFPEKLVGVFTHPRSTFEAITERDLTRGFLVVLLVAIMGGIASARYVSRMDLSSLPLIGQFPVDTSTITGGLGVVLGVITGIRTVTGWLIPALIIYIMARLSTGGGGFKRLLAQMGFASAPLLIQQALRLIDAYVTQGILDVGLLQTGILKAGLPLRILNQTLNVLNLFSLVVMGLMVVAASVTFKSSKRKMALIVATSYVVFIVLRALILV